MFGVPFVCDSNGTALLFTDVVEEITSGSRADDKYFRSELLSKLQMLS